MTKRLQEMGAFVRERRKALGLSQVDLAKNAGISQPNVSEIERGEPKEMEAATLIGLAAALRCDPRDIWHGKPYKIDKNALTDEQTELVTVYTRLLPRDQKRLLSSARSWLEDATDDPKRPPAHPDR
jgi:transcriptional regulator with XRE-family HTH domain